MVVKEERRSIKPLFFLKPSQMFHLFERELVSNAFSLPSERFDNRVFKEFVKSVVLPQLRQLGLRFQALDESSVFVHKLTYNAFYRIFLRLQWVKEAQSEREIEVKVWVTSSVDYLNQFLSYIEGLDD